MASARPASVFPPTTEPFVLPLWPKTEGHPVPTPMEMSRVGLHWCGMDMRARLGCLLGQRAQSLSPPAEVKGGARGEGKAIVCCRESQESG